MLSVGDAAFQKKCLRKMGDVAKEGRTVLFVSHNMPAVTGLCSRAVLLRTGSIAADGKPQQVTAGYLMGDAESAGERVWDAPNTAPGNHRARLHAVRIVCASAFRPPQSAISTGTTRHSPT